MHHTKSMRPTKELRLQRRLLSAQLSFPHTVFHQRVWIWRYVLRWRWHHVRGDKAKVIGPENNLNLQQMKLAWAWRAERPRVRRHTRGFKGTPSFTFSSLVLVPWRQSRPTALSSVPRCCFPSLLPAWKRSGKCNTNFCCSQTC